MRARAVEILDLDAEMVEPGATTGLARDQRHSDIAVADRNGRPFAHHVARRLEAEIGAVEHGEHGVAVGGDGKMVESGEHRVLPARRHAGHVLENSISR